MHIRRDPQQQITDHAADLRKDQHRPAADAIADHPQYRRAQKLADRINREEQSNRERMILRHLHIKRQQRNDDAEAHQIRGNDQEDAEQSALGRGCLVRRV